MRSRRLRMRASSPPQLRSLCPQLQEVIRSTINQQIHQHIPTPVLSAQQTLIAKTRQLLTLPQPHQRHQLSSQNQQRESSSVERARGSTCLGKNRRDNKLNQTKKQLEMLNQLYRTGANAKTKRYQEEILMEEAEIHATIVQHSLRRGWNTGSSRAPRIRPQLQLRNGQLQQQEDSLQVKPRINHSSQMDSLFERIHPYRRLLLQRKKTNGLVEPWQVSNFN